MSAILGLMPAGRAGVVVLLNLDHAELRHSLMYQAFDQFLGGTPRDWSAEMRSLMAAPRGPGPNVAGNAPAPAGPSLPLDKYTGVFVDSTYGKIQVMLADGVLRAQVEDERPVDLEPVGNERFRSRTPGDGQGTVLTFVPDGAGNVSAWAPAANGTPAIPATVATARAFLVTFSIVWFPCTVVTATSSMFGFPWASRSAIASSCPGSQSRMIFVVIATSYMKLIFI